MYTLVSLLCYLSPLVSSRAKQQHTQRVRLRSDILIQQVRAGDGQLHLRNTVRHLKRGRERERAQQLQYQSVTLKLYDVCY